MLKTKCGSRNNLSKLGVIIYEEQIFGKLFIKEGKQLCVYFSFSWDRWVSEFSV